MNEQIPLNKLCQSSTLDLQAAAEAGDALAQRVLGERYATFDEINPPISFCPHCERLSAG